MRILLFCYLLLGGSLVSYCQSLSSELLSSSGGYNLLGEVRMHWAVGEIAVEEHRNGIRLTEGFFQVYADAVTDVPELFVDAEVTIWPNPTTDVLSIAHGIDASLTAHLLDARGSLIRSINITTDLTRLSVGDLSPGTYFLALVATTGEQATYSFIKI